MISSISNIFRIVLVIAAAMHTLIVSAAEQPKIKVADYSTAITEFKASMSSGNGQNVRTAFLNVLKILASERKITARQQKAETLLHLVESSAKCNALEHIYNDIPLLVNTKLYGKQNSIIALKLLQKYGELKFKYVTKQFGLKGQRSVEFICYFRTPLTNSLEKLCESWNRDKKLENAAVEKFTHEDKILFVSPRQLLLLKEWQHALTEIFYNSSDDSVKGSVIACFILGGEYNKASIMTGLITKESASAFKRYISSIPVAWRGKKNNYYQDDPDEIR